ncbi:hypothetical protein ACT1UG_02460 [Bacillus paramycoides]|uniref:hypothetical protein n=1 Tax=Bacillus paramycoides TaxID=2026194 RepID=UPI0040591E1B
MNEQFEVKTSYLVVVGKLFVANGLFITNFSKNINDATEFDYDTAKELAFQFGGMAIRKTINYEVVGA